MQYMPLVANPPVNQDQQQRIVARQVYDLTLTGSHEPPLPCPTCVSYLQRRGGYGAPYVAAYYALFPSGAAVTRVCPYHSTLNALSTPTPHLQFTGLFGTDGMEARP